MTPAEWTEVILFYGLGAVSVLAALMTVLSGSILRAAVGLAVVLLCSAGFYLLLGAEFIAGIQVLVYIGGIVVLLVFAVMLTSSSELPEEKPSAGRKALGLLTASGFSILTIGTFAYTDFGINMTDLSERTSAAEIGRKLLDTGPEGYLLPFEVISLLLLASVIGAIVVAQSKPEKQT